MSIWSKIIGFVDNSSKSDIIGDDSRKSYDSYSYAMIDVEVGLKSNKIHDIGALRYDDAIFHKASKKEFLNFIKDVDYLCGHNIIHHDIKYLFGEELHQWQYVDTLYMSPLLFPERPYHKLVKDDKLINEQMNNPVNDCMKAKDLLWDEIACWRSLPDEKRMILISLLKGKKEFDGFLNMVNEKSIASNLPELISKVYKGKICQHADINSIIHQSPVALAYSLALIDTTDYRSITPGWVLHNYPEVEYIIKKLRHTYCKDGCDYCHSQLDIHQNLKRFFGFNQFRTYEGEALQEKAVHAAVEGKSLLAIFPTGGGKSLTFQLPALMEGRNVHGLTVVISPLQSLMKDQVDNLSDKGITDAATINGMLDPISRALSIQRVLDGEVSLLYIAPEMLRSKTIERILTVRNVVRFVIDEAHCFSSWGQDFRVDYLYIGTFIKNYQKKKKCRIPVSCFTATAKQKVIQDIRDYFKRTLDIELELFASTASRTNLQYSVIHADTDDDKYLKLRRLIAETNCPTIVYVSRTKRTIELANRLSHDGFRALPFNGRMDSEDKNANQEAFMTDQVRIIVATSAFGMGVDKKDVGLVIHYDISDSLENYVQEAGRAGRDPQLSARCYVLYSDKDLDKHFILLNQSKLSISEIQQIWKAVKGLTKKRKNICCSALELARLAGWDDSLHISYKQLNDDAQKSGIETSKEKDIRTLLYFLTVKGYIRKTEDAARNIEIHSQTDMESTIRRFEKRLEICSFIIEWLYRQINSNPHKDPENNSIQFSIIELLNDIKKNSQSLFVSNDNLQLEDVEESLLYLSKIGALKLEGGFLVLYNAMNIRRIKDNKIRYKIDDYRMLNEFYKQKIQQVHIVGEYANLMVKDYNAALQYVKDYFQMDYKKFITKYFKGNRSKEIERNLTPDKYNQLFGQLSKRQLEIISDKDSHYIVVAAGPGSGKTRVLVHKLASLLMLEDVKHEQLLMLTFSRAAATEFKQRLMGLIGNAAHFVEIKTFHSFCFDLLGRIGNLDDANDIIVKATEMIIQGDVEPNKIGKTVLVIDEAQDMSSEEYALVKALISNNEEMRVIAVGDDDQNIFEFRGSDSKYMFRLLNEENSRLIEMTENFRSSRNVVNCANSFINIIRGRMKSNPIVSMRDYNGIVEVTQYQSKYMYEPIVNNVLQNRGNGISCILTQTNEEAVTMVALLRKHGINGKLIQSMEGFSFWNLAEIRYFLKCINKGKTAPVIPQNVWEEAKLLTFNAYANSHSIIYVKRCVELFEQINKVKYYSDFREFVFESSFEDFCDVSDAEVVVSTIHKAKGQEFDDVYMMLSDDYSKDEHLIRRYYVGMTRAKNRLFIHTNGNYFNRLNADKFHIDAKDYSMPEQVVLQLTHKDVFLGFFKERKKEILSLRSGDSLEYKDSTFFNVKTNNPIAKLSKNMQITIADWHDKGYDVESASVRFVVAWRPKDQSKEEPEIAVILIDLLLTRNDS